MKFAWLNVKRSCNTFLQDKVCDNRGQFQHQSQRQRDQADVQVDLKIEEKYPYSIFAGGSTWLSPTQWPTHSMCLASRLPQSQLL